MSTPYLIVIFSLFPKIDVGSITTHLGRKFLTSSAERFFGRIRIHCNRSLSRSEKEKRICWNKIKGLPVVLYKNNRYIHFLSKCEKKIQGQEQKNYLRSNQGLLYHRTCKRGFLCSWPSLNSYLK